MNSLRLLVIGNGLPHPKHSVRAANVVIYELVTALSKINHGQVGYLSVCHDDGNELETLEKIELENFGVSVLNQVLLPPIPKKRTAWKRLFFPKKTDFYPETQFSKQILTSVMEFKPDVILVPWSEWLTALCGELDYKKFAYYGNPDPKAGKWRALFERRYLISKQSPWRRFFYLKYLEYYHLKIMRKYDWLGDVANNDVLYYQKKGIINAFYIQNLWIDRFGLDWENIRLQATKKKLCKIIINVGQLGGTANRYGLELLALKIAPLLRIKMKTPYELHILGKGSIVTDLEVKLSSPEIRVRGFVPDIDQELFEAKIFVCLNNAGPYKVGHTRYLHAWSLGMCVIAHCDAAKSMPEMINRKNCLLGENPDEIANLIVEASLDPKLRLELGRSGYETFRQFFTAEPVALKILEKITRTDLENQK